MIDNLQPGDVVLIKFPFASDPQEKTKLRPVVVIGVHEESHIRSTNLSLMITGSAERLQSPKDSDVLISNWRDAGLTKPSLVRLNRVWGAESSDFDSKLGRVSGEFLRYLQATFKTSFGIS